MCHVTGDMWQVTRDTWNMTHSVGWTFSLNFSFLALPVWDWQWFKYISTNHQSVSQSAVCRTAPATLGLLITNIEQNLEKQYNNQNRRRKISKKIISKICTLGFIEKKEDSCYVNLFLMAPTVNVPKECSSGLNMFTWVSTATLKVAVTKPDIGVRFIVKWKCVLKDVDLSVCLSVCLSVSWKLTICLPDRATDPLYRQYLALMIHKQRTLFISTLEVCVSGKMGWQSLLHGQIIIYRNIVVILIWHCCRKVEFPGEGNINKNKEKEKIFIPSLSLLFNTLNIIGLSQLQGIYLTWYSCLFMKT